MDLQIFLGGKKKGGERGEKGKGNLPNAHQKPCPHRLLKPLVWKGHGRGEKRKKVKGGLKYLAGAAQYFSAPFLG